jgi:putative toxin-antitoxin system antitoxin component (TIGR02293 family)
MQWIGRVRAGLPVEVVDRLLDSGRLMAAELDRLTLPRKTLAHRRGIGRLTLEQSDRLIRMRTIEDAEYTFGDPAKAQVWLRRPSALLDNEYLLDRLDTDPGARQVEALLGRIAHGIAA